MKVLVETKEVPNEGLALLLGQNVTFFCMNYLYTGLLAGVNDVQVKLDNPKIVYETGAFNVKDWKDAQSLPNSLYIRLASVEAYSVVK